MTSRKTRSRGYTYTLFDYTEEQREALLATNAEYVIVGEEICPTTERPHLQCYLYFANQRWWDAVDRDLPGKGHTESAKGSAQQNRDYCSKAGKFEERGKLPQQGKRSDLEGAVAVMMEAGKSASAREYNSVWIRYSRGMDRVYDLLHEKPPRSAKSHVFVVIGDEGTGKTRTVTELAADDGGLFRKARGEWWDGYRGEKWVIIDDFRGWMHYDEILRLCDRYPMRVPVKGGYVEFTSEIIVITSNRPMSTWWPDQWCDGLGAFMRRVCCVHTVKTKEEMALVKAEWVEEKNRSVCSSE